MGKSYEEMEEIHSELTDILFKYPKVNSVNISTISLTALLNERNISLKAGESPNDWCIYVTLSAEPPKDLKLIDEYKGVRIFYEVHGEIIPY